MSEDAVPKPSKPPKSFNFSLLQLIIGTLIAGLFLLLALPLLESARESARRTSCASNLNALGKVFFMYSDVPGNNYFPTNGGRTAADGYISLGLLYNNYVSDYRVFHCPSHPMTAPILSRGSPGNGFNSSVTSYCYDNRHTPNDAQAVILADKPAGKGQNSDNHGWQAGQNVLLGAGCVEFITSFKRIAGKDSKGAPIIDDITNDDSATIPLASDGFLQP